MSGMAYPIPRCLLRYELLSSPFATTAAARDVNGNDKEHSVKRELVFLRAYNLQRCATSSYAREINDATPEPLNPFFSRSTQSGGGLLWTDSLVCKKHTPETAKILSETETTKKN